MAMLSCEGGWIPSVKYAATYLEASYCHLQKGRLDGNQSSQVQTRAKPNTKFR